MNKYPTDEELELFIRQMEQQELYAPRHLKEQILSQAFPKQTVEALPKSGSGQGSVRLLSYRLKIIAGICECDEGRISKNFHAACDSLPWNGQ